MKTKDEGFRKLSEAAGLLAGRVRFLGWNRDDVGITRAIQLLAQVQEELFRVAVGCEEKADIRPLFDRPAAGGESFDPKPTPGTVAPAPPADWRSTSIRDLDVDDRLQELLAVKYRDVGDLADMLAEHEENDRGPDDGVGFSSIGRAMRDQCRAAIARLKDEATGPLVPFPQPPGMDWNASAEALPQVPGDGPAKYFKVSARKGNPLYCLTAASIEEAVEYVERNHGRDWDGSVREITPAEWVRLPSSLTTRSVETTPAEPKKFIDVANLPRPRRTRKPKGAARA